jgi:hypothetical protein
MEMSSWPMRSVNGYVGGRLVKVGLHRGSRRKKVGLHRGSTPMVGEIQPSAVGLHCTFFRPFALRTSLLPSSLPSLLSLFFLLH